MIKLGESFLNNKIGGKPFFIKLKFGIKFIWNTKMVFWEKCTIFQKSFDQNFPFPFLPPPSGSSGPSSAPPNPGHPSPHPPFPPLSHPHRRASTLSKANPSCPPPGAPSVGPSRPTGARRSPQMGFSSPAKNPAPFRHPPIARPGSVPPAPSPPSRAPVNPLGPGRRPPLWRRPLFPLLLPPPF